MTADVHDFRMLRDEARERLNHFMRESKRFPRDLKIQDMVRFYMKSVRDYEKLYLAEVEIAMSR